MAAINLVQVSEAITHNRFSAEFFDPRYVFAPAVGTEWLPIGRVLKKCEYGLSISMNSAGQGFPIFRMNELDGCFAQRPAKFANISQTEFNSSALRENDVLFNRTNSFEFVGRTGIVKDQTDCTFASYLIRLVPDATRLLPEFLTIFLNTSFGIGQIKRRAMRSINQANVSGSEVRKILIHLPGLSLQQEVANLVNAAFVKQRDTLSAYVAAQNLLNTALCLDKLIFQKPVGYAAQFSELESSRRCDADYFQPMYKQLDALAANYPNKRIKTISEKLVTGIYSSSYSEKGIPYIRGTDVQSGYIENMAILKTGALKPTLSSIAKEDDILVTRVGSIGVCGIVEKELAESFFSDNLIRIRLTTDSKVEISPNYLNLLLNTTYGQMQMLRYSRGSVQQRLNQSQLAQIPIPIIQWQRQQEIEHFLMQHRAAKRESESLLCRAKTRVEQLIEAAVQP